MLEKLENVVDIYLGITHTPEYKESGVPFLSVKDISNGKIDFSNCKYISKDEFDTFPNGAKPKPGDLLFCRVGTIGKPIIIDSSIPEFGSFVSLGFLRKKTSSIELKYLKYWMESNSFYNQVLENISGASQKNLNTSWLKKFKFKSCDISEQNNIIHNLDQIKIFKKLKEKQLSYFDNLIKSRFIEMFGEIIESKSRECTFENICTSLIGLTYSPDNITENGTIVLRSGNIQDGQLQLADDVVRVSDVNIKKDKYVNDLDILMCSRNGSARLVGKTCIIHNPIEEMTFGAFMTIIRTKYPYILNTFMNMDYFRNQLVSTQTASVNQITTKMLNQYKVFLPTDEEEKEFRLFVELIDKSKLIVQKQIELLQELLDKKMNEYFGD